MSSLKTSSSQIHATEQQRCHHFLRHIYRRTNQREWISLGTYTLQKGNSATITITTKDANGYVAADAILFVPVKK